MCVKQVSDAETGKLHMKDNMEKWGRLEGKPLWVLLLLLLLFLYFYYYYYYYYYYYLPPIFLIFFRGSDREMFWKKGVLSSEDF